ncbi:head maturation protease, ClpP-related [Flammeovirga sp. OC4]|uniref:head maturation protease, ClpP-related n=1 Tax=Flammeovirga sp. OC4 TaxID=1382345 RepID=UPI0005C567F1|nr:head maturation protease, ClpP-related [Flammeovirga sp. OC4]
MKIISKKGKTVKARLYGDIGVWGRNNALSFSNQIAELDDDYEELDLYMHCYGGEVFEGLAMFNVLRNSNLKVKGYVEGVAASMGTVLLLACDEVYMYKNTYQMIHEALAGAYGNSHVMREMAKNLETVSTQLYEHYKDKMPENKHAEIEKFMDGKDHWLTPKECEELGLIDGVIDKKGLEIPKSLLQAKGNKDSFQNYFSNYSKEIIPKVKSTMKETIIAKIMAKNFKGVVASTADELGEQLLAYAEGLTSENAGLKAKLEDLEKAQKDRQKEVVKNFLDQAQASGKIQESQRAFYNDLCKTEEGFTSVKEILNSANPTPPNRPTIKDQMEESGKGKSEDKSTWTFQDYQDKAPNELEKMVDEDFEKFSALYENQFGVKPEK